VTSDRREDTAAQNLSETWDRYEPISGLNGSSRQLIRAFADSKQFELADMVTAGTRAREHGTGSVTLAWAVHHPDGYPCGISTRRLPTHVKGSVGGSRFETPYQWTKTDDPARVLICEGESDGMRLMALDPDALVLSMSAGVMSWRAEWAELIPDGLPVFIAVDNPNFDKTQSNGRKASAMGATKIAATMPRAKRITPPDVSDWCEWQGNSAAFRKLLDNATPVVSLIPPSSNPMPVARLFLKHECADNRLAHVGGMFYVWRGTHWEEPESVEVSRMLYSWLEDKYCTTKSGPISWQPTKHKVADVADALAAVAYRRREVDGRYVSFQNGLLDRETRELVAHTPDVFNTYSLSFDYDSDPPTPNQWLSFLSDLWPDDAESIECLQEIFGYILVGGTSLQKMFMLVGPRRSGKGTIGRLLVALLGSVNACSPTMSAISSHFGMQNLVGKQLALISDARLGDRNDAHVAVERMLTVTGEDAVSIPRKYRDDWNGTLPVRFVVLTNEVPRVRDASNAFASRHIMLTLERSFLGQEDTHLTTKLLTEAPSIFAWALEGYDRLMERGAFVQPAAGLALIRQMEDMASPVAAFVRDRCTLGPELSIQKDALFAAWQTWCDEEGMMSGGYRELFSRDLFSSFTSVKPGLGPRPTRAKIFLGIDLKGWNDEGGTGQSPDSAPNAPNAGWFDYVPLALRECNPGLNVDFYALGLIFTGLSSTAAAINLIVTIFKNRAPGMSLNRMPLFCFAILATAFSLLFALPPRTIDLVFLELQRKAGFPLLRRRARRRPAAVAAPVLDLRSPRGVHHRAAGVRDRDGHHPDVRPPQDARLPARRARGADGRLHRFRRLGTPHVHGRSADDRDRVLRGGEHDGRHPEHDPGVRMDPDGDDGAAAVQGAAPLHRRLHRLLRARRPVGHHVRCGADRPGDDGHVLRRCPLPLHHLRRGRLPPARWALLLVPESDRAPLPRAPGAGGLLADVRRDGPDVLPDAHRRTARDDPPYLHVRARHGLGDIQPDRDDRRLRADSRARLDRVQPRVSSSFRS
jgi:putative DNA primase/helicase